MKFYINTHSNKVVLAKNRRDAKAKFGISFKQAANEVNLYDQLTDKKAIVPQELAGEVEAFKEFKLTHSLKY